MKEKCPYSSKMQLIGPITLHPYLLLKVFHRNVLKVKLHYQLTSTPIKVHIRMLLFSIECGVL